MMPEPAPKSRAVRSQSCERKIRHGSEGSALRAADRQAADFEVPMDVYRCPHCDGWHTGNVPRWLALDREYGVFSDP